MNDKFAIAVSIPGLLVLVAVVLQAIKLRQQKEDRKIPLIIHIVDSPEISFYGDFLANQLPLLPSRPKRFAHKSNAPDGNWTLIQMGWFSFNGLQSASGSVFRTPVSNEQLPLVCCQFDDGHETFEFNADAARARLFIERCLKKRRKHRKR